MKLQFFCLVSICLGLVACGGQQGVRLPEMTGMIEQSGREGCPVVYPQGKWQFVHAIDFTMQGGSSAVVLGVTSLAGDDLLCALVTVEGLTLFEAVFHQDGTSEVKRAVPPFDGPQFAGGLLRDIRAIFQPPFGSDVRRGHLEDGTQVCRYTDVNGGVVDVLPDIDDCWQIRSYTLEQVMDRSIVGRSCRQQGASRIPDDLELKTYGPAGYVLKMTLIQVDVLP